MARECQALAPTFHPSMRRKCADGLSSSLTRATADVCSTSMLGSISMDNALIRVSNSECVALRPTTETLSICQAGSQFDHGCAERKTAERASRFPVVQMYPPRVGAYSVSFVPVLAQLGPERFDVNYSRLQFCGFVPAAVLSLIGCSAGDEDLAEAQQEPKQAIEGLTIDPAEPYHLRGSFSQDAVTIHFEAIRGERNPDAVTKDDPNAPEYAVDARFYEDNGANFLLSTGGHGLEDEAWAQTSSDFDPDTRVEALKLVGPLVTALKNADLPVVFELERNRLIELGSSIGNVEFVHVPTGDVPYACTNAFVHQMHVRNKAAFELPVGNHTAVFVDSWFLGTSCTWLYVGRQESCNHGTCATSAEMATYCTWESGYRAYSFPAFQVYSAYSNGSCSTFYNPWSTLGGHNCNDDSYFQIQNIRNDTYYPAATGPSNICIDSIGHSYSPNCTGSRGAP